MCDSRVRSPLAPLKPAAVQIEMGLPLQSKWGGGGVSLYSANVCGAGRPRGALFTNLKVQDGFGLFNFLLMFCVWAPGRVKSEGFPSETLRFGLRRLVWDQVEFFFHLSIAFSENQLSFSIWGFFSICKCHQLPPPQQEFCSHEPQANVALCGQSMKRSMN